MITGDLRNKVAKIWETDPFRTVGSITTLFKDNMDDARKIIKIINNIKVNTEVV